MRRAGWRAVALGALAVTGAPSAAHAASPAEQCIASADAGQQHRDANQLRRARADFTACAAPECPALVRRDCAKWLAETDEAVPTLVFIARYDDGRDARDVTVSMDGAPLVTRLDGTATAVDPGEHELAFDVGGAHITEKVLVHAGEHNRTILVRLPSPGAGAGAPTASPSASEEPPPRASPPIAALVVGGVGVAALGAGIVVGALAKSDLSTLESAPCAAARRCAASDVDAIRARYVAADVLMGAGVVALGVAAYLWLTHHPSSGGAARVTAGGAALSF